MQDFLCAARLDDVRYQDTTHYHRNVGKDNVVLIAADIFKTAKQ